MGNIIKKVGLLALPLFLFLVIIPSVVFAQSDDGLYFWLKRELNKTRYDGVVEDGKIGYNTESQNWPVTWSTTTNYNIASGRKGTTLNANRYLGRGRINSWAWTMNSNFYIYPGRYIADEGLTSLTRYTTLGDKHLIALQAGDIIKIEFKTIRNDTDAYENFNTHFYLDFVDSTTGDTVRKDHEATFKRTNLGEEYTFERTILLDSSYEDADGLILLDRIYVVSEQARSECQKQNGALITDLKIGINNYDVIEAPREYAENDYIIKFTNVAKKYRSWLSDFQYALSGWVTTPDGTRLITGKFTIAQEMKKKFILWDNNSFEYMYNDVHFSWIGASKNDYQYLDLTFTPNDENLKVSVFRLDLKDLDGYSLTESNPVNIDPWENENVFYDREDFDSEYGSYFDDETGQFNQDFWNLIREQLENTGKFTPEQKRLDDYLGGSPADESAGLLNRILNTISAPFSLLSTILGNIIITIESLLADTTALFALFKQFFNWVPGEVIGIYALGAGLVVVLRVLGR